MDPEQKRSTALKDKIKAPGLTNEMLALKDMDPPVDPNSKQLEQEAKQHGLTMVKKLTSKMGKGKELMDSLRKSKEPAAQVYSQQLRELKVQMQASMKLLGKLCNVPPARIKIPDVKQACVAAQGFLDKARTVEKNSRPLTGSK